ncbi:hypothetical protein [Burkholderia sp. TSV86]|uniref:hypothetical protein n=1 Tax=Burkholderia sp. TSV86 TaxID=1385594 RepID=UPI001E5BEFCB|nr:hypothetical protein [Burkholderia sp. TSV86]
MNGKCLSATPAAARPSRYVSNAEVQRCGCVAACVAQGNTTQVSATAHSRRRVASERIE